MKIEKTLSLHLMLISQVITAGEKARKPPATQKYLFRMRESSLVKGFLNAVNGGNPLAEASISLSIGKSTPEKSLMNAANEENFLFIKPLSLYIEKFTLEEVLMSAVNVGNLLA